MSRWLKYLAALVAITFAAACGGSDDDDPSASIVQQVQADARFSVLAEALAAADLTETLSGSGPFTVFAPTDDAFGALLNELGVTKAQLLADKTLLTAALTYHVLPDRVLRSQVAPGKAVTTVQGDVFKIDASASGLVITDGRNRTANITSTGQLASNGVIHVIDKVLLPADRNIVQTAQANPDFSILVEAVVAAGLVDVLSAPGPLTVFAPTNTAFADLLDELGVTKAQLFADPELLAQVLAYHVVDGRVLKADVPLDTPITTLQGDTFSVAGSLVITDQRSRTANILATDVFASNGVIHVIDRVILPRP